MEDFDDVPSFNRTTVECKLIKVVQLNIWIYHF